MSFTNSFANSLCRARGLPTACIRLLVAALQPIVEFHQRRDLIESGRRLRADILKDIGVRKVDLL